jgi:hypothetical protein
LPDHGRLAAQLLPACYRRLVSLAVRLKKRKENEMYKRLLTTLTVVVALAGLAVVPVATAGQSQQASKLGEIGAWAVPSTPTTVSKPLPALSQQMAGKLGEIGLWAVPSHSSAVPKPLATQKTIQGKLGEIGAWAVPSNSTTPVVSGDNGFDLNNAELGASLMFGVLLIGAAGFVTIRRHQRPIAH